MDSRAAQVRADARGDRERKETLNHAGDLNNTNKDTRRSALATLDGLVAGGTSLGWPKRLRRR